MSLGAPGEVFTNVSHSCTPESGSHSATGLPATSKDDCAVYFEISYRRNSKSQTFARGSPRGPVRARPA